MIWATTANRHYLDGLIGVGAKVATVKRNVRVTDMVGTRGATWYFASDGPATLVLKVQRGAVTEVGIATHSVTASSRLRRLLAKSLT